MEAPQRGRALGYGAQADRLPERVVDEPVGGDQVASGEELAHAHEVRAHRLEAASVDRVTQPDHGQLAET